MSYRTSLPLHPTEDDKPKRKGWYVNKSTGKVAEWNLDSLDSRLKRRQERIKKKLGISDKPTTIRGTKAPTSLTKIYNKPR